MEPATMALVCVAVFGVIGILSAFIRQLLLSREKKLNDEAQQRALEQETHELEKIRQEMMNYKRYDMHYQMLGANKEAVQVIEERIEVILKQKAALIQRYAEATLRESSAIISGESGLARKTICDELKEEIDSALHAYEKELERLQARRANLWDSHLDLLRHLVDMEKNRNDHMDAIYDHHSALLEKVFLRHNENGEAIAKEAIEASTSTFKSALLAPVYFLISLFKISADIDPDQVTKEALARKEVLKFQLDLNESETIVQSAPKKQAVKKPSKETANNQSTADIEVSEATTTTTDNCKFRITTSL